MVAEAEAEEAAGTHLNAVVLLLKRSGPGWTSEIRTKCKVTLTRTGRGMRHERVRCRSLDSVDEQIAQQTRIIMHDLAGAPRYSRGIESS